MSGFTPLSPRVVDRVDAMQADPVKAGVGLDVPQGLITAQALAASFANACAAKLSAGADLIGTASDHLERIRAHLRAQQPSPHASERLRQIERVSLSDVIAAYNRGRG